VKVMFEFPKVGRKRLICTIVLSSVATVLWIAAPSVLPLIAPWQLPFATVTWMHVVEGIAIPFGVGWVTLLLMEERIVDERRVAAQVRAQQSVGAR
jgi:hypothetical protein